MQGIGHSLSGYASLILRSDEDTVPDKPSEAFPVHPDSLQVLSKESAALGNPPNSPKLSRTRTAQDDWYERLNSDVRTSAKPVRPQAFMQPVDLRAPPDLFHSVTHTPPYSARSRRPTSLLTVIFTAQPGSNKSIRVQMEMDEDGRCSCDGYLCASPFPLFVCLPRPTIRILSSRRTYHLSLLSTAESLTHTCT